MDEILRPRRVFLCYLGVSLGLVEGHLYSVLTEGEMKGWGLQIGQLVYLSRGFMRITGKSDSR